MPHTLLLADDSVTIQRVIELTFADQDIAVTAVGDGQEAVLRILSDRPDIVLADINLPVRDGYEIAALVKNDPALERIPVMLLSGAFDPVDDERARAVRCDGVLSKPFDPQVLLARVRELLDRPVAPSADAAVVGQWPADEPFTPDLAGAREDLPLDLSSLELQPGEPVHQEPSLDEYFDRLDAAFANLTGTPPVYDTTSPSPGVVAARSPRAADDISSVSEAFSRLLDAEQTLGPEEAHAAQTPGPEEARAAQTPEGRIAAPVVDDAFLDDVARRVTERIGEAALRDAVAQVVSVTAERLVREEIERLKATIK